MDRSRAAFLIAPFLLLAAPAAAAPAPAAWPPPAKGADQASLRSLLGPEAVAASAAEPEIHAGTGTKPARLSWELAQLAAAERAARAAKRQITAADLSALPAELRSLADAKLLRIDGAGRVQIYLHAAGTTAKAAAALLAAGGEVERADRAAGIVQGRLPVGRLEELAADPAVRFLRLPDYGFPQSGAALAQGDAILNAALLRSTLGVDGTGVRVGVISDGVGGIASAKGSGDLPASVNTATCNMTGTSPELSGAEGTAMLEIVHDLAPGAELWFGHFDTSLTFNAAVQCLAQNTDVVVDDIGFFNAGPYDGSSFVSANTSTQLGLAGNRIRGYATSVANQATSHYEESFVDSGFNLSLGGFTWDLHRFQGTARTTDAGFPLPCSGSSGPSCGNRILLEPGGSVRIFLQWNDPFAGSANDYDLFLVDETAGTIVAQSLGTQTGTQRPTEQLAFTNGDTLGFFDILIGRLSGAPRSFDLFILCGGDCAPSPAGTIANYNTAASSVPNQSDAGGGVLSVGAINSGDPNHDDLASYSSRGPRNDGQMKPDISAIDGVSVTGAGGFPNPFFGTSAASPHVAGILALLLDVKPALLAGEPGDNPAADRAALRQALVGHAHDLGPAGPDNASGFGRADALAAGQSLAAVPGICVPGPTTLCIDHLPGDKRFKVEVSFQTTQGGGQSGPGNAISLASLGVNLGGLFWFFNPANPEMLVKVLDGCALTGTYWVFYSAGTNVGLTTIVTDTLTGNFKTYTNPDLTPAPPVTDTGALPCS